jgi:hypothetical protein
VVSFRYRYPLLFYCCLTQHTHLQVLDRNRVKGLDPRSFEGAPNIRELRMEENGLRSLSYFNTLSKIASLHLSFNRIHDIGELDKLDGMVYLVEFSMASNPVARKQMYRPTVLRRLPAVKFFDGREAYLEERERMELLFAAERPSPTFFQDPRTILPPAGGLGMGMGMGQQQQTVKLVSFDPLPHAKRQPPASPLSVVPGPMVGVRVRGMLAMTFSLSLSLSVHY